MAEEYTIEMLEHALEKSNYVSCYGMKDLLPQNGYDVNKDKLPMFASVTLGIAAIVVALAFNGLIGAILGAAAIGICFMHRQISYRKRIGVAFGVAGLVTSLFAVIAGIV